MTAHVDANGIVDEATRWRERSEEIRTLAAVAMDSEVRAMMQRMAADCDRLAKWAEWRSGELGGNDAGVPRTPATGFAEPRRRAWAPDRARRR
jgi:hypothetical protein